MKPEKQTIIFYLDNISFAPEIKGLFDHRLNRRAHSWSGSNPKG
jgi:hypothetical protein